MIDAGLLASMAILIAIPALLVQPWPPEAAGATVLDLSGGALLGGLIVGRLSAVALDDPGSLTNMSDLVIIRSGVEFWPGVVAAGIWIALSGRRNDGGATPRLAAVAPAGLLAWACYEATCLIRGGCPGPISSIGLRPDGLTHRVFPVGLVVAAVAGFCAVILSRLHRHGMPNIYVPIIAVCVIAAIRSVASIWLPRIGRGITRQHRESIAVLALSAVALTMLIIRSRRAAVRQSPVGLA